MCSNDVGARLTADEGPDDHRDRETQMGFRNLIQRLPRGQTNQTNVYLHLWIYKKDDSIHKHEHLPPAEVIVGSRRCT